MDVIEAMAPVMKEINYDIVVEHLPERSFDVKFNVLDSKKLQEHTGWRQQIMFAEGLRLTRDWLRDLYD